MSQQLKPHFLAVCKAKDGTYFLSNTIYHDPMKARVELGSVYVRLASEFPAVVLDITRPEDPKPFEKIHDKKNDHRKR